MPALWRILALVVALMWVVGCVPTNPLRSVEDRASQIEAVGALPARRSCESLSEQLLDHDDLAEPWSSRSDALVNAPSVIGFERWVQVAHVAPLSTRGGRTSARGPPVSPPRDDRG